MSANLHPDHSSASTTDRALLIRLAVGAVLVILVVALAAANSQHVEMDYLIGSGDVRLSG